MSAPRRWIEDPDADQQLQQVLRGAPSARPLDAVTRRRLGAKVARVSALPLVAAGWLFVKSAAAALGVVLGAGAIAVSAGVIEWGPPAPAQLGPQPSIQHRKAPSSVPVVQAPPPDLDVTEEPAEPIVAPPPSQLNPTPTLPAGSASSGGLSAEAALLETARAQLRSSPSQALAIAAQHAARFPDGQLAAERTLIQIEALHRTGRDAEARTLARGLGRAGMYAERVRQLLGDSTAP